MTKRTSQIQKIQQFNHFYSNYMDFLKRQLPGTNYTYIEAQLLYELSERKMTRASVLTADLALNPGYLSRILTRFEKAGIIQRTRCKIDGRSMRLIVTEHGDKEAKHLAKLSSIHLSEKVSHISNKQLDKLVSSLNEAEVILRKGE